MAARPDRTDPVLDLRTLVERPQIAIDGTRYDILSPDEVSVLDFERFARTGMRLEALGALAAPTQEQQAEMIAILRDLAARIMVGVPEDVRDRLPAPALARVIEVFTGLLSRKAAAGGAGRSTGASRRPASSASTAGTRAGGSPKRRSRS